MVKYKGKTVYNGIAVGPAVVLKKEDRKVRREKIQDPGQEMDRVREAVKKAREQLQQLYDRALASAGEASAAIFEVHQMMLEDEDYLEAIENMIKKERVNAEYAAAVTGDNFARMFADMDDEYMKARSADVKDISNRLIQCLTGGEGESFDFKGALYPCGG